MFRRSVSGFRMYHDETSSMPSGFAWVTRMITSSRIRFVSASSCETNCQTISSSCWAPSTSVAWSPPSIQITDLPFAARRRAVASSTRPAASSALFFRYSSRFARFAGEERIAINCGRPSAVVPIVSSSMRGDSTASFSHHRCNWV